MVLRSIPVQLVKRCLNFESFLKYSYQDIEKMNFYVYCALKIYYKIGHLFECLEEKTVLFTTDLIHITPLHN
jgi:hypothetical protein